MKKNLFVISTVIMLATSAVCFADGGWKLAGTWNYTLSVPSATVNGYPASLTENGTITMNMTETSGVEYFSTFDQKWDGTLVVNGKKTNYSGSAAKQTINPIAYAPGSSYVTGNTQVIDGVTVTAKYTLRQTGQDSVAGTARLSYNGQTAEGTITATRPSSDGGSGGGCNAGAALASFFLLIPLAIARKAK